MDKVISGDIAAVATAGYHDGDTFAIRPLVIYEGIRFPNPPSPCRGCPKGEEDKVFAGLNRLTEEDPTLPLRKTRKPVTC